MHTQFQHLFLTKKRTEQVKMKGDSDSMEKQGYG